MTDNQDAPKRDLREIAKEYVDLQLSNMQKNGLTIDLVSDAAYNTMIDEVVRAVKV